MRTDTKTSLLTVCILCTALIPKALIFSNHIIEPFANSIIALTVETQASGHIVSNPYNISGTWQTHANFISSRQGIVSFFAIMSSVTGLSANIVAFLPLTGVMFVMLGYFFGRRFGTRFTALAFAMIFGYSWYWTLTGTSIGYQSYGNILQLTIISILVWSVVDKEQWSRRDVLVICILFFAMYQTYYMAEFLTLALFILIVFFSLILKALAKFEGKSLYSVRFLALWCSVIFMGLDVVAYNYTRTTSLALFESSILSYLSYVGSIIFGETATFQEYRPYTNPVSKYVDLLSSLLEWSIIALCIGLYLNNFRKSKATKTLTRKENIIHIIIFSFLSVFVARTLIYGLLGKIAIGWIYMAFIPVILAQLWLFPRSKPRLKYVIPIILVGLTIFRFSIIWTDQTLSFVGANYPPLVSPSAHWIANNLYSGSVVSTNQISAQVFSTIAESGKANQISVNQFGTDVKNLTSEATQLQRLLTSRGYNYMVLLKVFESQPLFGGFWGPYVPPLGNRLESFSNYSGFSRIYDDGMSTLYKLP